MPYHSSEFWCSVFIALVVTSCSEPDAIVQPIEFSHELHVDGNEMECSDCHQSVEVARAAGRPGVRVCESCHDIMLGESQEERRLLKYVEGDVEIPWRRLFRLTHSVLFSHARHVSVASIECRDCHGPMEEQQAPPAAALKRLSMSDCIDCHRTRQVRDDCNACHR